MRFCLTSSNYQFIVSFDDCDSRLLFVWNQRKWVTEKSGCEFAHQYFYVFGNKIDCQYIQITQNRTKDDDELSMWIHRSRFEAAQL